MWFVLTFRLVKVSFTRTIAPTAAANCRKFTARQTPLIRIIKIYSQFVQKTMDASHRFNTSRFVDSCALCSLCCQIIPFRTIVICLPPSVPLHFQPKFHSFLHWQANFPAKHTEGRTADAGRTGFLCTLQIAASQSARFPFTAGARGCQWQQISYVGTVAYSPLSRNLDFESKRC